MEDHEAPPPPPPPPPSMPVGVGVGVSDEHTMATLAHAGQLFGGFVVPLVIFLVKKDDSAYVADQAKEALNFSITLTIAMIVSIPLIFVLVGIFTLLATMVLAFVFPIVAAIAANRGEWYRYPICIRLIR